MTRIFDLKDVLELVNDGFNDRPFVRQQSVRKVHQTILHVFFATG